MDNCVKCGSTLMQGESFCRKCGSQAVEKRASRLWYLAPILFSLFGGGIAYMILKDKDKKMAKNCLKLGAILLVVYFAGGIILGE